jgi:hypothetical protein
MKEVDLRRLHRGVGITVAIFIILQAGSGFVLSLGGLHIASTHAHEEAFNTGHAQEQGERLWQDALEFIHLGGGIIGTIYRLLLGLGIVAVAVSGSMIFFKIRARSKRR